MLATLQISVDELLGSQQLHDIKRSRENRAQGRRLHYGRKCASGRTDLRKGLNLVNTSADLLNAGSIERASGRMLLSSLTIEKQMYS